MCLHENKLRLIRLLVVGVLLLLMPLEIKSAELNDVAIEVLNNSTNLKHIQKLWSQVQTDTVWPIQYKRCEILTQVDFTRLSNSDLIAFYIPAIQYEIQSILHRNELGRQMLHFHQNQFRDYVTEARTMAMERSILPLAEEAQDVLRALMTGANFLMESPERILSFGAMPKIAYSAVERFLFRSTSYMVDSLHYVLPDSVSTSLEDLLKVQDINHHIQAALDAFAQLAQNASNAYMVSWYTYEIRFLFAQFTTGKEAEQYANLLNNLCLRIDTEADVVNEVLMQSQQIWQILVPLFSSSLVSMATNTYSTNTGGAECFTQLIERERELSEQGYDFTTVHPFLYQGEYAESEIFEQYRELFARAEYRLIIELSNASTQGLQFFLKPQNRDAYLYFVKQTNDSNLLHLAEDFLVLAAEDMVWMNERYESAWTIDACERLVQLLELITKDSYSSFEICQIASLAFHIPFKDKEKKIIDQTLLPIFRNINWKKADKDMKVDLLFYYAVCLDELLLMKAVDGDSIAAEVATIEKKAMSLDRESRSWIQVELEQIALNAGWYEYVIENNRKFLKKLPSTEDYQDVRYSSLANLMYAYRNLLQYEDAYACYLEIKDTSNWSPNEYITIADIQAHLNESLQLSHTLQHHYASIEKNMYNTLLNASDNQLKELQPWVNDMSLLQAGLFDTLSTACENLITQHLYDFQLAVKGITLSVSQQIEELLLHHPSPIVRDQYKHFLDVKEQLNDTINSFALEMLQMDLQHTQNTLMTHIRSWNDEHVHTNVFARWQQIRDQLRDNEVAVEFIQHQGDYSTTYTALLLQHDWGCPKWIELCSDSALRCHSSVTQPELQQLIWQPILKSTSLTEGGKIYFSADGLLYQLPIEYTFCGVDTTMSDRYQMYRVSSTREIIDTLSSDDRDGIALYGGLHYSLDSAAMARNAARVSSYARRDLTLEKCFGDTLRAASKEITFLPGTLLEVNAIKQLFSDTSVFTGTNGREESFKALSGISPHILHVGTHGYYLRPSDDEIQSGGVVDYSMSRTGLLFAGAQNAWSGQPTPIGVEDGILTAKEIAQLDLRNVQMAVLSACETASGEITSDGVAGLQRGFKKAGVKTLVMSLWKVDDSATRLLMTEFYRNWIEEHQSKREAFKNAQNTVRYTVDEDGDRMYENPMYWAGFIMLD